MNQELELLKRNLMFFHINQQKELQNNPTQLANCQSIINLIEEMIDRGEIKDIMSMEAIYFYCMDKMKDESSKLNDYIKEIANFIC